MFNTKFESRFVEVRRFKNEDYPTFLECIKNNLDNMADYLSDGRLFKGFTDIEFAHIFRMYTSKDGNYEYFGAFYKEKCIGMIILCPGYAKYGAEFIYWVDKNHMNKGVATKMVNEITEHAFRVGYWSIECHTDVTNLGSQKVLEKNNFGFADKYTSDPRGLKDSGEMIAWIKFNPYERKPYGPKRSALEILKTRTISLNTGRY